MSSRVPQTAFEMNPETVNSLQLLVKALHDSSEFLDETANRVSNDEHVSDALRTVAKERREVCCSIATAIEFTDAVPNENGSFTGALRTIWASLRAAMNAGDATVILIEAEKAEDVIVHKFQAILPEIAGNPINDQLLNHYKLVKKGHDQILRLRNMYQG